MTDDAADDEQFNPAALDMLRRLGSGTLLVRMIDLFLANGPERIAAARAGLQSGDISVVERAVHSLKSSAAQLGGAGLQRTAAAVEHAAAVGDMAALPAGLDAIDVKFAALRTWLQRIKSDAVTSNTENPA